MWVVRRSIVDWDCSKTQTLLETMKIPNQPGSEFCASSEVEHSFLQVGCVRNKLQSLAVPSNLKFFLWTLVFAWTVSPLWITGVWLSKYCILPATFQFWETCGETKPKGNTPTPKRRNTAIETMLNYLKRITSSRKQNLLPSKSCFTFLKTLKQ